MDMPWVSLCSGLIGKMQIGVTIAVLGKKTQVGRSWVQILCQQGYFLVLAKFPLNIPCLYLEVKLKYILDVM